MLELRLSPKAIDDLEKIYEYTFKEWGNSQAEKYQDELYEGMTKILGNPEIGAKYIHTSKDYRKIKINRHLIFYRLESNLCLVMRILHERMDLQTKL